MSAAFLVLIIFAYYMNVKLLLWNDLDAFYMRRVDYLLAVKLQSSNAIYDKRNHAMPTNEIHQDYNLSW